MNAAFAAVVFAPALAIGSFLNVIASRLPLGQSISRPRSHCPNCAHPIAPRDNIPLLSYALLRGHCRSCQAAISWRYPAVELATAALATACVVAFGASLRGAHRGDLLRCPRDHLRHRHRTADRPEQDRAAGDRDRARSPADPRAEPRVARCRVGGGALPVRGGTRIPERHGHGRRQACAAHRRGRRLVGAGGADGGNDLRPRPLGRAPGAARRSGAEACDPVRAVPRLRRDPGAVRRSVR